MKSSYQFVESIHCVRDLESTLLCLRNCVSSLWSGMIGLAGPGLGSVLGESRYEGNSANKGYPIGRIRMNPEVRGLCDL